MLAKRLAQFLTSILPSGVHLKALETYHIVFNRIGHIRLATDLPIYAGGLFPLLSHCSTPLKGPLLPLYETHFLPLRSALCPILDGLVLAILPGLEDETSDFFARSVKLMDSVAHAVGDNAVFSRSLWRALLLSPPVRYAAAHYIRSKLATDGEDGDNGLRGQMVGDMPLVAYAITAALSDDDALTQRNVLDLLLGEVALDAPFFRAERKEQHDAAIALVGGVFATLLRRDISLTKRVHTWLLGGKDGDEGVEFCTKFSKHLVLAAVDNETKISLALATAGVLSNNSTSNEHVHHQQQQRTQQRRHLQPTGEGVKITGTIPCKIVVALMDRPELCECLGHHIARRMLDFGRLAIAKNHKHANEISNAVADVLHDLGSARVFADLEQMLRSEKERTSEDFELLSYSLSMFPTKDHVVRKIHLPALLQVAVRTLNDVSKDMRILDKAVGFCSKAILAMGVLKSGDMNDNSLFQNMKHSVSSFAAFFVAWLKHTVKQAPNELKLDYLNVNVADEYTAEVEMAGVCEERKEIITIAKSACSFFVTVATAGVGGADMIAIALKATAKCASAADVRVSLAGARSFADVSARAGMNRSIVTEMSASSANMNEVNENGAEHENESGEEQIYGVIRRCWRQMHPSLRTATAQSAQTLLALQRRYPEEVKVVMADGILSPILSRRLRNLERFACLWRLAVEHRLLPLPADNGLFLMLDALTDEHWGPKMLARSWLSDALEVDSASVIDAPLRLLLNPEARSVGDLHEFVAVYDAPRALYAFQTLRSILESSPTILGSAGDQNNMSLSAAHQVSSKKGANGGRIGVRALAGASPSPRTVQALATLFAVGERGRDIRGTGMEDMGTKELGSVKLEHLLPAHNYAVAIALTCLGYLRGRVPEKFRVKQDLLKLDGRHFTIGMGAEEVDVEGSLLSEDEEDLEWTLAGLGSKSMLELHKSVSAAAAECLATLLTAIPVPSQMGSVIASLFAEPVLNLIVGTVGTADPVLELHFLNAMSFLVTSDGPCYLSSVQGKGVFSKALGARRNRRISFSDSQSQVHILKRGEEAGRGTGAVEVGAVESLESFIPWLLKGVANTCQAVHSSHDSGSQEVLGVRRRWIQLMDTVMKHVGASLPVVTQGLILILSELLGKQEGGAAVLSGLVGGGFGGVGDSEFSRVDETLVLLDGLAVVTSNVLWSFELALSNGDLKDGTQSTALSAIAAAASGGATAMNMSQPSSLEPSTKSLPSLAPKDGVAGSGSGVSGGFSSSGSEGRVNGVDSNLKHQIQQQVVQSSMSEAIPSFTGNALVDKASISMSTTTASMINALNPLRMINDFVKDVWIGSGVDNTHRSLDPRRSGARALFCLIPTVVRDVALVWGPSVEFQIDGSGVEDEVSAREGSSGFVSSNAHIGGFSGSDRNRARFERVVGPPRLSAELPRERRQAQRASVLSILEPIFEIRPLDVVASTVSIFYEEQDEFGVLPSLGTEKESPANMACQMLHALDSATSDVVVHCVKIIFEKAVKWENGSAEAIEGRLQATLQQQARSAVNGLLSVENDGVALSERSIDVSSIGKMAPNDHLSPLPGGSTGIDLTQIPVSITSGTSSTSHQELFHWGDYFAVYAPGVVQTACLNFMEQFLLSCKDGDETQAAWTLLFPLLRDGVATVRRKAAIPAILRVLGTFVSMNPSPYPERRIRREIMLVATLVIASCGALAGGQTEIPSEEHGNASFFKKKLSVVALRALSVAVPPLMDSAFFDDKPQLSNASNLSINPAVTTLKKAAGRAAAIAVAANSGGGSGSKKWKLGLGDTGAVSTAKDVEKLIRQESESAVYLSASEAAADVILNIGGREWGLKMAKSKLLSLVEDGNFFFGKNGRVLRKMSAIVREVVANGGASFLLTSLGTWSSNSSAGSIPSLFIGRDSESVLRGRAIRRIAYIIFVSEADLYSSQLPLVLERIRDVLRMSDTGLVGECLFCLRALLLRTGPSSIAAFRATILAEMFRILGKPKEDLATTMSVLRFLDVVTLLSPPDYGYERCFFFGEEGGGGVGSNVDGEGGVINDGISNAEENGRDSNKDDRETEQADSGRESMEEPDGKHKAYVPLVDKVAVTLWRSWGWSKDEVFAPPLRMESGKPVLHGGSVLDTDVDAEFVGRYAAGLVLRNAMPMMKAAKADGAVIRDEFEAEFLQDSQHH